IHTLRKRYTLISTHNCVIIISFGLLPRPPLSTVFPYTTLFRYANSCPTAQKRYSTTAGSSSCRPFALHCVSVFITAIAVYHGGRDRKSTRLNSSHVKSSYAVFCLKKKKPEII